ncbi:intercellular adhesion molecule 5-like isoform X9 [Scyliorhinus torazame]|uniref:intercellular adhesion molecule 5-like isoform X9 n=1 Tax=Scyliorhinus torazame TaxID=75743 RepID=UPI003B58F85A
MLLIPAAMDKRAVYIHIVPAVLAFWIQPAIVTGFEITLNTNPPAVEFGASFEMNCTTTCPDPIINVEYKPGIHPNRTTGSNWITDYFPSVQAWDFTAPCNMICKSQNNSADEQKKVVTVYNREINITSPPEVLEVNRTYSLECIGPRVYPNNKLILTWLRGSETLQINSTGEQGFPDEDIRLRNVFSFTASVSDDGQEYTCLAEVDLGSNSTKPIANCSVTLRAHYKPGDTTISVNNKTVSGFPVTVRKGDEVTMICNSNGNPTPTLKWEDPSNSSNVEIGSPGVLRISHATSGHQGIYQCRATNRYGIEEKEVDIRVTDKPGDTTISVNNKTVSGFLVTVRKGDEVTMICNSNGNPTPTLKWEDPSNSSNVEIGSPGVLRISHATSGHQGIYKCRATNRYGIEEKEVDIRVTAAIVTGFEITLNTNPPAVEFGASLEMNCTTTCPDPIINVEYKPGIHPNRTTGSNWITDYFPSVQAWDFTAPCNMICKSQNNRAAEQKVVLTVYNREINITSPPEVLEVNRTYSLECIGPRVYPNNKLILTWLRGSETLQINSTGEQGFPDEDIRLRNVFSFTASVSDDGQEYTCLAEVDLGSNSTKPIANCSVTLRAHSIVTGFEITLNTNPPAVEFGASFEMNCTTTCPDPIINVEYKPGIHPNRTTGSNWITDYFPSVQAWDFTAPCNMICKSQNNSADEQKKVVTVYNREINITSPPEVLEVNRTYSLECIGPRVYPNNKLILTWLRGSETLQINSTGEQGFPDEDIRLRNVFSFTASVSDDGQEYTCLAEVDLGSNSTKPIANCSVTLRAHYKPGDTTISVNNKTVSGFPVTVRKGDEVTMICNSNGNPTPTLKWEDPSNSSNVEIGSPGVLRISHATSGHQGVYKCRATNRYGIEEKEVDIRVTAAIVTGFEITLNTNPPAVEFGASLEMNCTTTCPDPIINVEYKPGIHPNRTTGSNWITDYFPSVQAWDFTAPCNMICKSQNNRAAEQKVVVTVYNREINITSPPEVLEVNRTYSLECIGPRVYPNNKLILTWLRGSETLQINSTGEQGFPDEDIRLRNVFSFTASVSDDGQEYTCLAEVDLGSNSTKPIANCSVTLRAHYKPGDTTISVNNKTVSGFPVTVRKGDEVTMICNSNGNPTPTLKWEDPSNSSNVEIGSPGVLRISHATSGHQGVYKCRATNRYGIEEKEVDIRVTGQTSARRLAAKFIGLTSVVIVAGAFLLSILSVLFQKIEIKTE